MILVVFKSSFIKSVSLIIELNSIIPSYSIYQFSLKNLMFFVSLIQVNLNISIYIFYIFKRLIGLNCKRHKSE